jgi:hypothetical protein
MALAKAVFGAARHSIGMHTPNGPADEDCDKYVGFLNNCEVYYWAAREMDFKLRFCSAVALGGNFSWNRRSFYIPPNHAGSVGLCPANGERPLVVRCLPS